jgi:4-amino-4-deoxy-L-arabinose transferase-like glycosyltransferase
VAYIWFVRRNLEFGGDPYYYHASANVLADGQGFISPYALKLGQHVQSADHPPLYVVYLALFSLAGVRSVTGHLLVSGLLGAAAIPMAALAGREIAGRKVGVVAALLVAFYPNIWRYDGMLLSETLVIFLVVVAVWLAYRYVHAPSWGRLATLAVVVGLCALARSELLLLAPLLVIPLALGTRSAPWSQRWRWLAAATMACLVAVAPWMVFNLTRFDHPVFFTDNLGGTLAVANCDSAYYGANVGYWDYHCGVDTLERHGLGSYAQAGMADRTFREDALAYIGSHKSRLPVVVLARLGRITGTFRPSQQMHLDIYLESTTDWVAQGGALSFYLVAGLAVVGGVVLRRRRVVVYPLLVPVAVVLIAAALFYAATRFRAAAEPSLCLLSAVAVVAGWDRWRAVGRGSTVSGPSEPASSEPAATGGPPASPPASPAPAASTS